MQIPLPLFRKRPKINPKKMTWSCFDTRTLTFHKSATQSVIRPRCSTVPVNVVCVYLCFEPGTSFCPT